MTNDTIRIPEWHGCPAFRAVRDQLRIEMADLRHGDVDQRSILSVSRLLGDARVIKVEDEQIEACMLDLDDVRASGWFADRLPFNPLFIEWSGGGGTVVTESDGRIEVIPFIREYSHSRELLCGQSAIVSRGEDDCRLRPWLTTRRGNEEAQSLADSCALEVETILAILRSTNVLLGGEPLPRQQRRDAERRRREIPLTIQLRRGHRKSVPRGGTAKYSHAFEVRAHIQFHTRGPIFDHWSRNHPDRVFDHPDRGPCVQVWHPGAVKGSGIFVPKVRDATAVAA